MHIFSNLVFASVLACIIHYIRYNLQYSMNYIFGDQLIYIHG